MKKTTSTLFLLILTLACSSVIAAVNITECEDEAGNRSFQKTCPPGSTLISEKKIQTGPASNKKSSNANIQATLYLIPDCEACEEIKEFLNTRNISVTEKNVNDNLDLQTELTELTGSLKVPTTVIGEEVLTGYSRTKFLNILKAAGYTDEES